MYEAEDYHGGGGGGHHTQGEEADTERARLKRSASLTSSHRSHHSRHRELTRSDSSQSEGFTVIQRANQKANIAAKSPVISFRNNASKYGNYELTPIFIFDKTPKSSQTVSYHTLPSGGYSQVKSQRMEIKFGISGMLKPQKEKKEKNSNKTSTLKRKWSLKFPKLDKRDNSGSSNVIGTRTSSSDAGADKSFNNSNNNKPDYRQKAEKETSYNKNPPPHRPTKHKTRAWVQKKEAVVEADLDDIRALEQLNYEARTLLDDVRLDEGSQINVGPADRMLDFQELYQTPLIENIETEAEIYPTQYSHNIVRDDRFSSVEREPYDEVEIYENDNYDDYDGHYEIVEDEIDGDKPTFDDLNNFIDSLAMKVNELELGLEGSEEAESKESEDSVNFAEDDASESRSRRSGSILKHPGQKRRHIKHVEFLCDVMGSDQQNCDNVRYF